MTIQANTPNVPPAGLTKVSYEEFLQHARNEHAEWVDGEVIAMAPVSSQHQFVSLFLVRLLSDFVEHHQLGSVFFENFNMKTSARPSGRNPDVMFVSNANRNRIKSNHIDGPADLAIEIVSADDPDRDRLEKFSEYERGGVSEYWLIEPAGQRVEFFYLGSGGTYEKIPISGEGIIRSIVVPGFWMNVRWLWDRPPLHTLRGKLGLP